MARVQSDAIIGHYECKTIINSHPSDGGPGAGSTLSGCCNQKECGRLPAVCLQRWASADQGGCLLYPQSWPSCSWWCHWSSEKTTQRMLLWTGFWRMSISLGREGTTPFLGDRISSWRNTYMWKGFRYLGENKFKILSIKHKLGNWEEEAKQNMHMD